MSEQLSHFRITEEEAAVNRIRSILMTLRNMYKASSRSQKHPLPSLVTYAAERRKAVYTIGTLYSEDAEVNRWVQKFDEFLKAHDLVESID